MKCVSSELLRACLLYNNLRKAPKNAFLNCLLSSNLRAGAVNVLIFTTSVESLISMLCFVLHPGFGCKDVKLTDQ